MEPARCPICGLRIICPVLWTGNLKNVMKDGSIRNLGFVELKPTVLGLVVLEVQLCDCGALISAMGREEVWVVEELKDYDWDTDVGIGNDVKK